MSQNERPSHKNICVEERIHRKLAIARVELGYRTMSETLEHFLLQAEKE